MVPPSCAVTTTAIGLLPTLSTIGSEAFPLTTVVPFTLIVAFASTTVGVTVMVLFMLATPAV
jgi:hypothetical protein